MVGSVLWVLPFCIRDPLLALSALQPQLYISIRTYTLVKPFRAYLHDDISAAVLDTQTCVYKLSDTHTCR